MQRDNSRREKVLDDLARVAGGTVGVLSGFGREIKGEIKSRMEDAASELDLVSREEFDRFELILTEALKKQAELEERLSALETKKK